MKYNPIELTTLFYSALIRNSLIRLGDLEIILNNPNQRQERFILQNQGKKVPKTTLRPKINYRLPKFTPKNY